MKEEVNEIISDIKQIDKEIINVKKISELERKALIFELKNGLIEKIKHNPKPIIIPLTKFQKIKLIIKKIFNVI